MGYMKNLWQMQIEERELLGLEDEPMEGDYDYEFDEDLLVSPTKKGEK